MNAFISVDSEGAVERARRLDSESHYGRDRSLSGMVVAVKDNICIRDREVTCASGILSGFRSLYSATAVERLEKAGAIVIGKTNCDEFGMGSSNESSFFGPVLNPFDPERVAGGSSGGSAAAVADGMCHVALGTDTGGSIRQPASFCGVVGLKPTYGRVSRFGLVAYASSLDTIGPITGSIKDAVLVLEAISGKDENDQTTADMGRGSFRTDTRPHVGGLRIGLPEEFLSEGIADDVREAIRRTASNLESGGAAIVDVSLPTSSYGVAAYYILASAEASSNLARYDGVRYGPRYGSDKRPGDRDLATSARGADAVAGTGLSLAEMYEATRSEGFGEEVKRRIMLGTYVLSAGYYGQYYEKAQRVRTLVIRDFDRVFENVDVLLTPTSPTTAFRLGEKQCDPLRMYLSDVFTVTANLAGIPGLSIPAGADSDGMPIGVQLLGPLFSEQKLLNVGRALERFAENRV